jgi:hypothetical protein
MNWLKSALQPYVKLIDQAPPPYGGVGLGYVQDIGKLHAIDYKRKHFYRKDLPIRWHYGQHHRIAFCFSP